MPLALRVDFDAAGLRMAARRSKNAAQARRLLALAAIYDGATRTEAARIGGITVQIVCDWVVKFSDAGPDGLIDRKPPGQPSLLNDTHRAALAAMVESGPIPAVHGVVRWRIVDLRQWVWEEFRISIARQTLSRDLRKLGYNHHQPGFQHLQIPTAEHHAICRRSQPSDRTQVLAVHR